MREEEQVADDPCENNRNLSAEEIAELRRIYTPQRSVSVSDLKSLMLFTGAGTLLSTPFALLFLGSAYFLHDYPPVDALMIGLLGFLPGVVLGFAIAAVGWWGAGGTPIPGLQSDLSAGICVPMRYRVRSFRGVVDNGDPEVRDMLLELGETAWLALPWSETFDQSAIREALVIWQLPRSGIVVATEFEGDYTPPEKQALETPGLWRNDDLPFYEEIKLRDVPHEYVAVIRGAS